MTKRTKFTDDEISRALAGRIDRRAPSARGRSAAFNEANVAYGAEDAAKDDAYPELVKACKKYIRKNPDDGFLGNACDHVAHGYAILKKEERACEKLRQNGADGVDIDVAQSRCDVAWSDLDEAVAELGDVLGNYDTYGAAKVKSLKSAYRYFALEATLRRATDARANARQAVEATLKDFAKVADWLDRAPECFTDVSCNAQWEADSPLAARESAAH